MRRYKGHIEKHGTGWRVFATVRDNAGKTRRVSKVVRGTRAQAEETLRRLLETDGIDTLSKFGQVLDSYLAHCEARVANDEMSESTLRGYRSNIDVHIRPKLGGKKCADMTSATLNRFLDSLDTNRPAVFRTLRIVCKWAYKNGYFESDLTGRMDAVPSPPPKVTEDDVYTYEEVLQLVKADMPPQLRIAVVLSVSCALRRGEIAALDWGDYRNGEVTVRKTYGRSKPKTDSSAAVLAVPKFAQTILDKHRKADDVPMISWDDGTRLHPDTITHLWEGLWKRPMPVKRIPFKNLRHTSLTFVYQSTGDILAASKRGRHSNVTITDKFYVRSAKEADRRAADSIDRRLGS